MTRKIFQGKFQNFTITALEEWGALKNKYIFSFLLLALVLLNSFSCSANLAGVSGSSTINKFPLLVFSFLIEALGFMILFFWNIAARVWSGAGLLFSFIGLADSGASSSSFGAGLVGLSPFFGPKILWRKDPLWGLLIVGESSGLPRKEKRDFGREGDKSGLRWSFGVAVPGSCETSTSDFIAIKCKAGVEESKRETF